MVLKDQFKKYGFYTIKWKVVFYEYSTACKKTYRKDILTNSTALFFTKTTSWTVPEKK